MASSTARNQIATALMGLEDCPESVKMMLLSSLPNAFGPNVHKYQQEVALMIRKTLETARSGASEAQAAISQSVDEARTALEVCQADEVSMKAAEDEARAFLDEKSAALESRKAAVKKEDEVRREAEAAKEVVAAETKILEEAKAELESLKNGYFQMLLDGGWGDEELRDQGIEAVCNYLQEEGGDVVLLAALPKALSNAPANRGDFDAIAVEAALTTLSEKMSSLAQRIEVSTAQSEDAEAEYLGAWAIWDVARDQEKAASDERDEAEAAHEKVIVQKKLAMSKVQDQDAALAAVLTQATLLEGKLQQLDQALMGLTQLEAGDDAVEKENVENAMEVDKENKGNVTGAEQDIKASPMAVDVPLPIAVSA